MPTAVATRAGRTADRIAVVSGVVHAACVGFGIFLVDESDSAGYWFLVAFAALGLAATVLGWASVRAGRGAWVGGVVVLGLSIGVLAGALLQEGGLGMLSIAIPLLFIDYLVFSNAQRALHRP
ncbi:MAG TPA: hypothetical protein VFT70_18400 [Nocardioides sp.]|nr:hypothetical protein [Nocardioides sp.]